jgi:hypothetical protein
MILTELAANLGQNLLQPPTTGFPNVRAWRSNAHYAGHALWQLLAHTRHAQRRAVNDFGDEYPMITALYESYQAQCKQLQAFAELRGDSPEDVPRRAPMHH